jgi:general secretion pathway protein M
MKARLAAWWNGLSRRERAATLVAALVAGLGALYLAAIEPAWRSRARLEQALPQLRAQAMELDSLAAEAKKLRTRTRATGSAAEARTAAVRLAAQHGIAGSALREEGGERLVLTLRRGDAGRVLAWLKAASTTLPVRIVAARIVRAGPGVVDADITLDAVAAP